MLTNADILCQMFLCCNFSMNLGEKQKILQCAWWKDATDDWWQEDDSFRVYLLHQMLKENNITKKFWNDNEREYRGKLPYSKLGALAESQMYLIKNLTLIDLQQLNLDNLCRQWQSTGM